MAHGAPQGSSDWCKLGGGRPGSACSHELPWAATRSLGVVHWDARSQTSVQVTLEHMSLIWLHETRSCGLQPPEQVCCNRIKEICSTPQAAHWNLLAKQPWQWAPSKPLLPLRSSQPASSSDACAASKEPTALAAWPAAAACGVEARSTQRDEGGGAAIAPQLLLHEHVAFHGLVRLAHQPWQAMRLLRSSSWRAAAMLERLEPELLRCCAQLASQGQGAARFVAATGTA